LARESKLRYIAIGRINVILKIALNSENTKKEKIKAKISGLI